MRCGYLYGVCQDLDDVLDEHEKCTTNFHIGMCITTAFLVLYTYFTS